MLNVKELMWVEEDWWKFWRDVDLLDLCMCICVHVDVHVNDSSTVYAPHECVTCEYLPSNTLL